MDKTQFHQKVEMALRYLRDVVQLRVMDLAEILVPEASRDQRGWELSRYLLQQINRLRPPEEEGDVWVRCRYDLLTLRYVNGLPPDEVASRLNMSRRHFYRQLSRAVDEFADFLWAGLSNAAREPDKPEPELSPSPLEEEEQLALLQQESQTVTAGHQTCPLTAVVEKVLELLTPIVQRHSVTVHNELPLELPQINLSPEILKQFLVSLLGHLVASPETTEIVLEARQAGGQVILTISCHRTPSESTSPTSGDEPERKASATLAMLQGARMETVERDPHTTVYRITLPASACRYVLVVDDNQEVCLLLGRYLKSANYYPLIATNARQAIDLARSTEVCAVTLDLMMKGQDGWDILQALQHDPATEHLPIIVISVLDQEELALMLGATAFLKKPIKRDSLLRTLETIISA